MKLYGVIVGGLPSNQGSKECMTLYFGIRNFLGGGVWNQQYEKLAPSTIKTWGDKQQVADFSTGRRMPSQTNKISPGAPMSDVWDIGIIAPKAKERLGYPTQKPLKLLNRIITASSNEGDLVLDPFCGCGTTVDAAQRLNRKWVGIDISSFAIDLIKNKRLKDSRIPTQGIPHGLDSAKKLATDNPFNFESWAITRLQGFTPNTKQVGDGGIDGRANLAHGPDQMEREYSEYRRAKNSKLALAQVKSGYSLSALRDFIHVVDREDAVVGVFVTLNSVTSKEARKEVVKTGKVSVDGYEYPRVQLWSIQDYFDNKMPQLPIMTDPYSGKIMSQRDLFHQPN